MFGYPGEDVGAPLGAALERVGVRIVENVADTVEIAGILLTIAGASDLWQSEMSFDYQRELGDRPLIFLAHNPDTAYAIPADINYDLMLSGHTHGGQIRFSGHASPRYPNHPPIRFRFACVGA